MQNNKKYYRTGNLVRYISISNLNIKHSRKLYKPKV